MEQNLEIDADRRRGLGAILRRGRRRACRGHELDHTPRLLVRSPGRPDHICKRRPGPRQGIRPWPLHAAHHGDDPAPVLRDLHVHLGRTQDPFLHEAPRDLGLQLGGGEPLGVHGADQGQTHIPAGAHPQPQGGRCRRHRRGPEGPRSRPGHRARSLPLEQVRDADVEEVVGPDPIAVVPLLRALGRKGLETGAVAGTHHVARSDGRRSWCSRGGSLRPRLRSRGAAAAEHRPEEQHRSDRGGQPPHRAGCPLSRAPLPFPLDAQHALRLTAHEGDRVGHWG